MEHPDSERIASGFAYALALAGTIILLVLVMGGEWMPRMVLIFGAASVALMLLFWRGSRFVLVHAIHGVILYAVAALISTWPLIEAALVNHGHLLPHQIGANEIWVDPVPATRGLVCILIGFPLLILITEALMAALRGEFLENWPPLRWLQDWLIERPLAIEARRKRR